jgi:hypothetical protein
MGPQWLPGRSGPSETLILIRHIAAAALIAAAAGRYTASLAVPGTGGPVAVQVLADLGRGAESPPGPLVRVAGTMGAGNEMGMQAARTVYT